MGGQESKTKNPIGMHNSNYPIGINNQNSASGSKTVSHTTAARQTPQVPQNVRENISFNVPTSSKTSSTKLNTFEQTKNSSLQFTNSMNNARMSGNSDDISRQSKTKNSIGMDNYNYPIVINNQNSASGSKTVSHSTAARQTPQVPQHVRENISFNVPTISKTSSTKLNTFEQTKNSSLQFTNSMNNARMSGNSDDISRQSKTKNSIVMDYSKHPISISNQSNASGSKTASHIPEPRKTAQVAQHVRENISYNVPTNSKTSSTKLNHTIEQKETSSLQFTNSMHNPKKSENSDNIPIYPDISFMTDFDEPKFHTLHPTNHFDFDPLIHEIDDLNLNFNAEKECKSSEPKLISIKKISQAEDVQNSEKLFSQVNSGVKSNTKSTENVLTSLTQTTNEVNNLQYRQCPEGMAMKQTDSSKINNVGIIELTRTCIPSAPVDSEFDNFISCDFDSSHDRIGYDELYQGNINLHQLMDSSTENYKKLNVKYHSTRGKTYARGRTKRKPNAQCPQFQGRGRGHNYKHSNKQSYNHNNMTNTRVEHIAENDLFLEQQSVYLTNKNYYSSMESVASTLSQNEFGSNSKLSDDRSNQGNMGYGKKLGKYKQKHYNGQELSLRKNENECTENISLNKSNEPFDRRKWKSLRDLSVTKPNDVVKLLIDQTDFSSILNEEMEFEDVVLVSSILSSISNSTDERKSIILWHTIKPEFFNKISKCIISLHIEFNKESVNKLTDFVFNISTYCYSLIQLFPKVSSYIQDMNEKLELALKMFELHHEVQLRSNVMAVIKKTSSLIQNSNTQNTENLFVHEQRESDNQVISDFRRINIIPSLQYLNDVIVHTNNTVHHFTTINDYLEHCFTSEWNSFLSSLNVAVNYARSRNRRHKMTAYQLHKNIEFGSNLYYSESTYVLIFGKNNASLNSKQFLRGSLLFLTEDSFDSILFASVYDAHPKYLSNGRVIVNLLNWEQWKNIDFQTKQFDMLETSIMFENYECILKGLQNKSQVAKSMYEYFMNYKETISKPCYIHKEKEDICFNIDDNIEEPFTECTWHLENSKNLDTSQTCALKTALSNEFTLIKGGPGTGKTFLCLKVIRAFLLNSSVWSRIKIPILVIFENKDVLDHFLELLIKIENNVLSIGKTHKSHNMTYKINEMKEIIDMGQQVAQCKQMLNHLSHDINIINSNTGIISIKSFEKYIHRENLKYFMFNNSLDDTLFVKWLVGAKYDDAMKYQGQYSDFYHIQKYSEVITAISFPKLIKKTSELDAQIRANKINHFLLAELQRKYFELSSLMNILKDLVHISVEPLLGANIDHINLWNLEQKERWNMYYYWRAKFRDDILQRQCHQMKHTNVLENALQTLKHEMEIKLINKSSVVALTVSDALRIQSTLGSIDFKIVIVNEADRISDSELVLSIPHSCQHLIMFGDEKVSEIRVSKQPLSLFYRMCDNYNCVTLTTQHRMLPEISNMVLEHFYDFDSWNSGNTLPNKSKKVLGIKSNMVFINHDNVEKQEHKILSFINDYEAMFVIALCQYLLLQGYSQKEITILSMYGAQISYIQNKMKQLLNFNSITIKSVDNYKGKENRIVILSLVRNNDLGCLQDKNKVAIAFSRAREGLYVIGCLNRLSTKHQLWKSIQNSMLCQDLVLQCQIHNNQELVVVHPDDFKNWFNGSCQQICKNQLACGHICKLVCHLKDRNHANYKCREPCKRSSDKCTCKRSCPNMCFEDCAPCKEEVERTLPCGHTVTLQCFVHFETYNCNVEVPVELPCGHKGIKYCHQKTPTTQCTSMCENRLPCGHQCSRKCHIGNDPDHLQYICKKPCVKRRLGCTMDHKCQKKCHEQCDPCTEMVNKKLPCDHSRKIMCNKNTKDVKCLKLCKQLLKCGHPCKLKCFEPCSTICHQLVQKKLPVCGHVVDTECSALPHPSMCLQPCQKILSCSHKCQNKCNEMCTTGCKEMIISDKVCLYGHQMKIQCSLQNRELTQELSKWCSESCQTELKCGHKCQGTCGSCFQGRMHTSCKEDCGKPLICGHICDSPCPSNCPPCEKPCSYSCIHSKCSKLCGEPCIHCIEKCVSGCPHSQCTKLCYELCDREPCAQPCMKRLKCDHKCIGFCGEPCPTLCRICNVDEVTTVLFGFEVPDDDYETRFVYLEDCKHNIESRGLEKWLTDPQDGIMMKCCPICRVPILKTQRYMNIIKIAYQDVSQVKIKSFGKDVEIEKGRQELEKKFQSLKMSSNGVLMSPSWEEFLRKYKDKICAVRGNRRNTLNQLDIYTLDLQVELLRGLIITVKRVINGLDGYSYKKLENQIMFIAELLICRGRYLSAHEVNDINLEVDRFYSHTQLCQIESNRQYKNQCNNPEVQMHYDVVRSKIHCWKPFSSYDKKIVQMNMEKLKHILHINFSDVQRVQFLKLKQMKQGRWYKCPNGHFYVITECGRPVVTSTCPECHEKIGGLNKKLLTTNKMVMF